MEAITVTSPHTELRAASCIHCNKAIPTSVQSQFCCHGCETVYHLLQNRGLGEYYNLKATGRSIRKPVSANDRLEDFNYIDDPDFLKAYSYPASSDGSVVGMKFYLEGVHCAACVWLTEKVAEFVIGVANIRLNLSTSVATVTANKGCRFSEVAAEFQKMGYQPHPVKNEDNDSLQKRENRLFLIRLAVAGAAAGNIMLFAISLYGGATGTSAQLFRYLSFALFLPVMLFSAVPFYTSSIASIRNREPSIDIPVIFGILVGSIVSTYNLFTGDDRIYFDSLSSLVFLLLATRYFLKRVQQTAMGATHLLRFLTPTRAHRKNDLGIFEDVSVTRVKVGDTLQVFAGECIPVDGVVIKGTSSINCSFLTGESRPEPTLMGKTVYAGTVNLEAPIEIQVLQPASASRLANILETMENALQNKTRVSVFADRVSRYFLFTVMSITMGLFVWGLMGHWHESMNRALAVAIVTCPCAFAFATPLALSLTLGRLAKSGILVKSPEVLEKLTQIKTLFLDKTGTLTEGKPVVTEWRWEVQLPDQREIEDAVFGLESLSRHPIARAITQYLSSRRFIQTPEITKFTEKMGKGVSGEFNKNLYQVERASDSDQGTQVVVLRNQSVVARVTLKDQIRPETFDSLKEIQAQGLVPSILSGDTKSAVIEIASQLGIPRDRCMSEASPESKSDLVRKTPFSLMVGDGANDAIALASSHVGIAVHSGVEISMRAADVYLSDSGVKPISNLLIISKETIRVIYRTFALSFIYNIVAGVAAFYGKIDPLFAALLMPASALTVFLSAISGTKQMRNAFRGLEK